MHYNLIYPMQLYNVTNLSFKVVSLAYLLTALFGTAVWELLQHTLAAIGLHISLGPLYTTAMTGKYTPFLFRVRLVGKL